MKIGQIIKAYREKMQLSQEVVAEFLKIKREALSYYETDSRETPLEVLEKLSDLFGIGLDEFFEEDENQIKANVAFAFRADEILPKDMNSISAFRKVIKNYFKLVDLEKKIC
jgi:transcriptional regulator with XRE-family HTH domain